MRTNKLFLTALLGIASVASSFAADVYSVNVVGYVNVPVAGGGKYTMVANQLKNGANKLSEVIPTAPLGSSITFFSATTGFSEAIYYSPDLGGWISSNGDANATDLSPGTSFFFYNPEAATNLTFVGEVVQTPVPLSLKVGFNLAANHVPVEKGLDKLGYTPTPGDYLTYFDATSQQYSEAVYYSPDLGGWVTAGDRTEVPKIGEAFFLYTETAQNVNRTFSVAQ